MKRITRFQLVQIDWLDAATDNEGWKGVGESLDTAPMATTIGFIVKETAHAITVASTVSDDSHNARILIPTAMIQAMRELRQAYKKKVLAPI